MSNTGDLPFVNWPDGTFVEASLTSPDPGREVRGFTRIWFPGFRRTLVEGLLGDFDGTAANDLRIRGGAMLPNPTEQELYTGGLRDSWSIQGGAAVSLFSRGTDPYDPAWPDSVIDPNEFPAQDWNAATQLCRDEGLTDFWLVRVCAIDVLTTGNPAWAHTAADAAFGLDPLIIGVAVHPRSAVVHSAQQIVLTAIVGGTTDEVVWSASGGAINGDGDTIVFTPPAAEGRYSVTATLASDPTVNATAQVDVVGVFLPMSTPVTPATDMGH